MTTLKQILCAILNFGHPYDSFEEREYGEWIDIPYKHQLCIKKKCSCGKVWEMKR